MEWERKKQVEEDRRLVEIIQKQERKVNKLSTSSKELQCEALQDGGEKKNKDKLQKDKDDKRQGEEETGQTFDKVGSEDKLETGKGKAITKCKLQTSGQNDGGLMDIEQIIDDSFDEEEEDGKVQLEGSEDFLDSQESDNSFARAVGMSFSSVDKMEGMETRRVCLRLKEKKDKKALDLAIGRKEAQNSFINRGDNLIPSFL
ncbi:hypothetical protein E2562_038080 [Oryza meyeriana var. granulata]|uniref:Uncharacterized protein n=1 Tax=Oryza meyeriana var. granulata TaxID=110450 RepID=A0A6G1DA36_9ORYZ|nr:hypothetical protein E2562_038080 [Oryza meyeriana var. granulata]